MPDGIVEGTTNLPTGRVRDLKRRLAWWTSQVSQLGASLEACDFTSPADTAPPEYPHFKIWLAHSLFTDPARTGPVLQMVADLLSLVVVDWALPPDEDGGPEGIPFTYVTVTTTVGAPRARPVGYRCWPSPANDGMLAEFLSKLEAAIAGVQGILDDLEPEMGYRAGTQMVLEFMEQLLLDFSPPGAFGGTDASNVDASDTDAAAD